MWKSREGLAMLKIRMIMNSPVEDVFAFRTCCGAKVFDQNLEIQVTNRGDMPVEVPSYFDLIDEFGSHRVDTLMPHGVHRIEPGETKAFYCTMDENRWKAAQQVVLYDTRGNNYSTNV